VRARFDLMVVTDPSIERWRDALEAALGAGGARVAVQLRAAGASDDELRGLAKDLRGMIAACGAPLIVNDRVEIARAVDGVHLKERGMEVGAARALLGADAIVGASCHDAAGLARRSEAD
jgi:thiamine-phosphate pyrophosphorylase